MYRLFSDAFHAAMGTSSSSERESAVGVAERRERWLRERRDREAFAEFLMTSDLGRRVAAEMGSLGAAPAGQQQQLGSRLISRRGSAARAAPRHRDVNSDDSDRAESADRGWRTSIEEALFADYAKPALGSVFAATLARAGVPGVGPGASPPRHAGRVVATSGTVVHIAADSAASAAPPVVGTAIPISKGSVVHDSRTPTPPLPARLVSYLVHRWRAVALPLLLGSGGQGNDQGVCAPETAERLAGYLRGCLPCYCALIDGNRVAYLGVMLDAGVDGAIMASLKVLFPLVSSPTPAAAGVARRQLALFELLLLLLAGLHLPEAASAGAHGATRLTSGELLQGSPAALLGLPTGFPDLSAVNKAVAAATTVRRARDAVLVEMDWVVLEQERCELAADLALTYLVFFAKGVKPGDQDGYSSSSTHRDDQEEEQLCLASCTRTLFRLLLPLRVSASQIDPVVAASVNALRVLLARYDRGPSTAALGPRLLGQVSCGLVLVAQLLRECPAPVAEALNSADVFEGVTELLLRLGARFVSGEHDDAAVVAVSERFLTDSTAPDAISSARLFSVLRVPCERPAMLRLAADPAADECLHGYLGLLTARVHARASNDVAAQARLTGYLDQLELALVKAFLITASPAERGGGAGSSAGGLVLHSCLYDTLIKYVLDCLPPVERNTFLWDSVGGVVASPLRSPVQNLPAGALPVPPPPSQPTAGEGRGQSFRRLVDGGLYRILLGESAFFDAFRRDARLLHAVVFILFRVLTGDSQRSSSAVTGSLVDASSAAASAAGGRNGVDSEVEAVLDSFFEGRALVTLRDPGAGPMTAAAFLMTEMAWRDGSTDASGPRFLAVMGVVLFTALAGPRAAAFRSAMAAERGFLVMALVAKRLEGETQGGDGDGPTAAQLAQSWAFEVMSALLHDDAARVDALARHPGAVLGLVMAGDAGPLCRAGEGLLTTLLCHHTSATATTPTEVTGYVHCMQPLVAQLWAVLSECANLTGVSSVAGSQTGPACLRDPVARDSVLLALLGCVRAAVTRLRSGALRDYVSPVRALQHVLCDPQAIVGDGFVHLVHRAAQPWHPAELAAAGLRALLSTITLLVSANPALRTVLFQTIGPRELVECIRAEWPADAGNGGGFDWRGFTRAILGLAYEVIPLAATAGGDDAAAQQPDPATAAFFGREWRGRSIQNAELVSPLLHCFAATTLMDADGTGSSSSSTAALCAALDLLAKTMESCRASLFLLSSAGVIEALAELLTAVSRAPPRGEPSPLLPLILRTMKLSCAHHIHPRQMKQLLMSIVHAASAGDRVAAAGLIMEVICSATADAAAAASLGGGGGGGGASDGSTRDQLYGRHDTAALAVPSSSSPSPAGEQQLHSQELSLPEPAGYIALRRDCGVPGVKAVLHEFSLEGYTVCLWLRMEAAAEGRGDGYRTIFCIQSPERKTVVELRVSPANLLSVSYQGSNKMSASIELGCGVPHGVWTHLCLVQRPASFLAGAAAVKATLVYVNGALVATSTVVPYPPISRGYFYLGICGDDFEQRTVGRALTGQVTSVYLLGCSLGEREAGLLFLRACGLSTTGPGHDLAAAVASRRAQVAALQQSLAGDSLAFAVATGVAAVLDGTAASMIGLAGDAEKQLMDRAILCIDPRLAEKDNRLYNFSAVLRGRQRESFLITFEGTLVCNTTNALDAVCVLGALPTVAMPFTVMLVNVQLPFSPKGFAPTQRSKGVVAHQGADDAVHRLICLVDALTGVAAVRLEMIDSGLFVLLAAALEEVGPALGMRVAEHLLAVCVGRLLGSPALFEAAYASLFMSTELLHACPPGTQLIWINCQRVAVSVSAAVRAAVRSVGAQMFLASEIVHVIKEIRKTAGGDDHDGAGARHGCELLEQLLSLFEALCGSPVLMGDALAIQSLVSSAYLARAAVGEADLVEVLRRVRLLLSEREGLLCQYLGRNSYAADLLLLVRCPDSAPAARLEALLQMLLLTSRSRRTQEAMNPTLLATQGGLHVLKDVSLAWLKGLLQRFDVDVPLYMALRCALVGQYGVRSVPTEYAPLGSGDAMVFASVLSPILTLMKRTRDRQLKALALTDLLFLLRSDSSAWRKLLAVQGWYILVVSLHTTELHTQPGEAAAAGDDGAAAATPSPPTSATFPTCVAILAIALHKALVNETYGATELESAVTYMEEQAETRLLNAVLCAITEKLTARVAACPDPGVSSFLGFGTNTALVNVTAFVYRVEDVIFYLQHARGPESSYAASGDRPATPPAPPPQRTTKTSYTEWDALRITTSDDDGDGSAPPSGPPTPHLPAGLVERKLQLMMSPDGYWLHVDLATKLAALLSTNSPLLNCGGTTLAGGAAETLFAAGAQYRKGGFLRIFARLVRVAASMTLRAPAPLEALICILSNYACTVDDGSVSVGFLLLKKRAGSLEEAREHSSMLVTMSLIYAVHDLLIRRLRSADARSGAPAFAVANAQLVEALQNLFSLFKQAFEQLACFTGSREGDGSNAGEQQVCRERTVSWLSPTLAERARRGWLTSASSAARSTQLVEAYAEVASRTDYNAFLERCVLVMEREQITDKLLAGDVPGERAVRLGRLRAVIVNAGVGQQAVAEAIKSLVEERAAAIEDAGVSEAPAPPDSARSFSSHSGVLQPRVTAAKMTSAVRAGVWIGFRRAIQGTIWNVEAAPGAAVRGYYVSVARVEQQALVRRKLLRSTEGTSHRHVTDKATRHAPPLSAASANGATTTTDESPSRLRLRGGEAVLLESSQRDLDEEEGGAVKSAGDGGVDREPGDADLLADESASMASSWTGTPDQWDSRQQQHGNDGGAAGEVGDTGSAASAAAPVVLSLPCEVPYLMHCWSATLTIRGSDVCILIDEENTAYNQKIATEALPYLSRPRNVTFSATSIAQIAPARRFRMKRTGLEMWLRDRRSFLVNFADAALMRLAVQKVCHVASSWQQRESKHGGLSAGRRLVTEVAAGLLARPRANLLGAQALAGVAPLLLPSAALGGGGGLGAGGIYVLQDNPVKEPLRLHFMQEWQKREMTNLDYLLWLNLLSGRSVNDITQHPVFPWILADYASESLDLERAETFRDLGRPIGACGSDSRRGMIQQRYEDMKSIGDVPAHYFTHYSSPAVVIYYMVRLEPFTTLQLVLQGGHFDHPDRMFHSISAAFRAVTTSTQDARELIPELFYLPEVCVNNNDVHFGCKQDGGRMDGLELPPWANGSPHEFVYMMRAALESDHVSANLHRWIDLVFGASQRGKDAIEALNVFNWHSYEDLDRNRGDAVDQLLLIDSLDNIGQTPIQLFRQPHCSRHARELASPLECGASIKTVYPRFGTQQQQQRIALLSLNVLDKVIVVGGTGVAVSLKLLAQPLKRDRRYQGASADRYVTARSAQAATAPGPGGADPVGSSSSRPALVFPPPAAAGSHRSGSPPPASPQPGSDTGSNPSELNLLTAATAPAAPPVRPASSSSGAFEVFSFDISDEYDRRIPPMPPGVIPMDTIADAAAAFEGPCQPHNSVLLTYGAESYVVLGGMYDNSVLLRPMSGSAPEVRLTAHRGRVVRLAASGDSQYLVTGAEDTTFVVWGCGPSARRRPTIEVRMLFTIYGHEDNPTAAQVNSELDLVATASSDGALMLHSLSSGSLDHTIRHPGGHSIDHVLIQSTCYVPNVLYLSQVDNVIHQVSLNGTPLRSFTPPGRLTSWAMTSEQYLVLACTQHNRAAAAAAEVEVSDASSSATGPLPCSAVVFVHSFFLYPLRAVPLPADTVVQCIAVHPRTPQIAVMGTKAGSILLLRSSGRQSTIL